MLKFKFLTNPLKVPSTCGSVDVHVAGALGLLVCQIFLQDDPDLSVRCQLRVDSLFHVDPASVLKPHALG